MYHVEYAMSIPNLYLLTSFMPQVLTDRIQVRYGENAMAIKVRLSRILGEWRISQAELSRRSGISKYAIHKLYNEKSKGVEFATLDKLCATLDCSVGDLLEYVAED